MPRLDWFGQRGWSSKAARAIIYLFMVQANESKNNPKEISPVAKQHNFCRNIYLRATIWLWWDIFLKFCASGGWNKGLVFKILSQPWRFIGAPTEELDASECPAQPCWWTGPISLFWGKYQLSQLPKKTKKAIKYTSFNKSNSSASSGVLQGCFAGFCSYSELLCKDQISEFKINFGYR